MKGKAQETHLAIGADRLAATAQDLVDVEEDCLGQRGRSDVWYQFKVATLFTNEQPLRLVGRATHADWRREG